MLQMQEIFNVKMYKFIINVQVKGMHNANAPIKRKLPYHNALINEILSYKM